MTSLRGLEVASCRFCRHETNLYGLAISHSGGEHWGYCMGQYLRRNQLAYALNHFHGEPCCCGWNASVTKRRQKPCNRCNLQRATANAVEVWWQGHELIDQARAALSAHASSAAPEHHLVPATEQGALL